MVHEGGRGKKPKNFSHGLWMTPYILPESFHILSIEFLKNCALGFMNLMHFLSKKKPELDSLTVVS